MINLPRKKPEKNTTHKSFGKILETNLHKERKTLKTLGKKLKKKLEGRQISYT